MLNVPFYTQHGLSGIYPILPKDEAMWLLVPSYIDEKLIESLFYP